MAISEMKGQGLRLVVTRRYELEQLYWVVHKNLTSTQQKNRGNSGRNM